MSDDAEQENGWSRRQLLERAVAGAALGIAVSRDANATGTGRTDLSPKESLRELLDGNRRFAAGEIMAPHRELARVKAVAAKQTPFAAVLGCADSRVPVEILFDEGFGTLFVVRVAGNIATATEIASLEYAVEVLGVKVIVVLGHSNCGAVKAAFEGAEVPGQISTLYQHITPAFSGNRTDLDAAIHANVRFQALKLREGSTIVSKYLAEGKLLLAGAYYDLSSGRVTIVDV